MECSFIESTDHSEEEEIPGRTINRSPPASQACAGASASDRSPLTESPDVYRLLQLEGS